MEHVAILDKKRKLLSKILSGEKTIESRWYVQKRAPWGRIKTGETVYFKESGESVKAKADVEDVIQVSDLNTARAAELLDQYGKQIGIDDDRMLEFLKSLHDKKYCILVLLKNVKSIESFAIKKTGFGNMSAWLCVDNVKKLRK